MLVAYGRNRVSVDTTLTGALGPFPFAFSGGRSDSVTGLAIWSRSSWCAGNQGVNNYMTYVTGDIPVGVYNPKSLANMGFGHSALDGGVGYTYFDLKAGHEFSAVLGFTYNFINPYTQYQNGVDMHLDWAASHFLTKQLQVGVVGYFYNQVSCNGGSGDRVGCFESRVVGVGPQIGYIIPLGAIQAYLNVKGYKEFDAQNRPHGWNAWLTVQLSPAPPTPTPPPSPTRSMYTK